ncbi:MAG: sigma-54-dependent Fis family transcriptional regulator [Gammaproteobacteria bacterium]|nr:sigma-54-dependent Fis family transcriptional regulator [Gammaproteobacteria bacterium]
MSDQTCSESQLPKIIIAEDDLRMRELVATVLEDLNAECVVADSAQHALDLLESSTDVAVVVTDLRMPFVDGMDVLNFARRINSKTQVVMVTGHGTVESAVEALKAGAFDYIRKPFDNVELLHTVNLALEHYQLGCENERLRKRVNSDQEGQYQLLFGRSPAMAKVEKMSEAAAAYDCSVLIGGESGCGKELIARRIHNLSSRHDAQFVALNCAAIPENIIESELFGYLKGAFTGADRNKIGLFTRANGGTLFLDEINNASLSLQAKLLRVLQDGSFYVIGDTEPRSVDVRVIAASNRNLPAMIESNDFRQDLYYRLKVVDIDLPPLRDRRQDIPLLANFFLSRHAARINKQLTGMSTKVLGALMRHDWPGNVRELENVVLRMAIMTESSRVNEDALPPELAGEDEGTLRALDFVAPQSLDEVEAYFIRKTLREQQGDRALSAEILGIDKSTLWRKMKRYDIKE